MNISNKAEFMNVAESWYKRTHWLRRYFQQESYPMYKRMKALILFVVMTKRMQSVTLVYTKMNMPVLRTVFQSGGTVHSVPEKGSDFEVIQEAIKQIQDSRKI